MTLDIRCLVGAAWFLIVVSQLQKKVYFCKWIHVPSFFKFNISIGCKVLKAHFKMCMFPYCLFVVLYIQYTMNVFLTTCNDLIYYWGPKQVIFLFMFYFLWPLRLAVSKIFRRSVSCVIRGDVESESHCLFYCTYDIYKNRNGCLVCSTFDLD